MSFWTGKLIKGVLKILAGFFKLRIIYIFAVILGTLVAWEMLNSEIN